MNLTKIFAIVFLFFLNVCAAQTSLNEGLENLRNNLLKFDPSIQLESKDTLVLLTEIYYKSKEVGYKEGQLKALDFRSNMYYNSNKLQEALVDLEEGLLLAKELKDHYQLANLYFGKGISYTKLGLYDKAVKCFDQGFIYSKSIEDKDRYHYVRMNLHNGMMWHANFSKKYPKQVSIDHALNVYKEAKLISQKFPHRNENVVQAGSNLASVLIVSGKGADEAKIYLNEIQNLIPLVPNKPCLIAYNTSMGLLENEQKNYTNSIKHFSTSAEIAKKFGIVGELPLLYRKISESYEQLGDFEKASSYMGKSRHLLDSLTHADKKTVENLVNENQIQPKSDRISPVYFYLLGGIVLVIICGFLYYKFKSKNKSTTQYELPLEKLNSIDFEKSISLSTLVQNQDQDFYSEFLKIYPQFIQKLLAIDPLLKTSDLEYCALMKLNLDTKQIAVFKNTSIKAVESKKYRLKKRLQIPPNQNLYIWISQQ